MTSGGASAEVRPNEPPELHGAEPRLITVASCLAALTKLPGIPRVGHRPVLLTSVADIAGSLVVFGAALCVHLTTPASAAPCVVVVLAFITAFSVGLGPLAPAYGTEILQLRLRAQGTSLGIAANRLTCGILSMTFISLANSISMAGCFFLYASTAVAAWVFVYVRLLETKGRNLESMEVLFAK